MLACVLAVPLAASIFLVLGITLVSANETLAKLSVTVPDGFTIQRVTTTDLVERPMFAAHDAQGRLFVLESGGVNGNDRGNKPPDSIRCLTDTDGDGVYDKSTLFADKIVFGTGMVCYDNAVFITSPPSLWKLEDTTGDGMLINALN